MNSTASTINSTFYCHACAENQGVLDGLNLVGTAPSTYQIDKAKKHAGPGATTSGVNSVLDSGSTAELDELSRRALREGFVEIEPNGCRSLVYQSSEIVGTSYDAGVLDSRCDSIRLVLSSASSLVHPYPVSSKKYEGVTCADCGTVLIS